MLKSDELEFSDDLAAIDMNELKAGTASIITIVDRDNLASGDDQVEHVLNIDLTEDQDKASRDSRGKHDHVHARACYDARYHSQRDKNWSIYEPASKSLTSKKLKIS